MGLFCPDKGAKERLGIWCCLLVGAGLAVLFGVLTFNGVMGKTEEAPMPNVVDAAGNPVGNIPDIVVKFNLNNVGLDDIVSRVAVEDSLCDKAISMVQNSSVDTTKILCRVEYHLPSQTSRRRLATGIDVDVILYNFETRTNAQQAQTALENQGASGLNGFVDELKEVDGEEALSAATQDGDVSVDSVGGSDPANGYACPGCYVNRSYYYGHGSMFYYYMWGGYWMSPRVYYGGSYVGYARYGSSYGGYYCFPGETEIVMADGSSKAISEVQIGEHTKGGKITGLHTFDGSDSQMYEYHGVVVAGSHTVQENGVWMKVKDSEKAKEIDDKFDVLYDIDTSAHRIYTTKNPKIKFADYEEVGYNAEIEKLELNTLNSGSIKTRLGRWLSKLGGA